MNPYFKPSVCIDAVFEGKSYEEACKTVKKAGISAIEFWGWWDRDLNALQKAQKENNHFSFWRSSWLLDTSVLI